MQYLGKRKPHAIRGVHSTIYRYGTLQRAINDSSLSKTTMFTQLLAQLAEEALTDPHQLPAKHLSCLSYYQ